MKYARSLTIGKYLKYLQMQSTLLDAEKQRLLTCQQEGVLYSY